MLKYLILIFLIFIKLVKCQDDDGTPTLLAFPTYFYNDDEYPASNPENSEFCHDQPNVANKLGPDGLPEYCCGDSSFVVNVNGTNYVIFRNSTDFYKYFTPTPCLNFIIPQNYTVNATVDSYGYKSISPGNIWKLNASLEEIYKSPDTSTIMAFFSFYGYVGQDNTPSIYILSTALTILYIDGNAVPPTSCLPGFIEYNYTLSTQHQPGDRINISIFTISRAAGFSVSMSEKDLYNIDCEKDSCGICKGGDQYCPELPEINVCQDYALECGSTVVVDKNCTNDSPDCQDVQCSVDQGGCYSTSKCGDSNSCFLISCLNGTGCVSSEIHCDDNDPCTLNSCNNSTGCVYSPMVCDTLGETLCLKNTCYQGKCSLKSNCTETPTPHQQSTTSSTSISSSSTSSTISTPSTISTTSTSTTFTSTTSTSTTSTSTTSTSTTIPIPIIDYMCRYDSCPFNYECIQLDRSYSCVSNQFCRDCNPDELKVFY